ncbi:MAG: 50S ribosomal protein L9, partial [Armatimonadota bacterium]
MQVILTTDVDRLGREGDVVDVSPGYARNYLFRRRLAVEATKGARKDLELRRSAIERRQAQRLEVAQAAADRLKEFTIRITRKAGEDGRLHGAVTSQDIADAVREQTEMDIERRHVELPESLRRTGAHLVTLRLGPEVEVEVPVDVVP